MESDWVEGGSGSCRVCMSTTTRMIKTSRLKLEWGYLGVDESGECSESEEGVGVGSEGEGGAC